MPKESPAERFMPTFRLRSLWSGDQPMVVCHRVEKFFACQCFYYRHSSTYFRIATGALVLKEPITAKKSLGVFLGVSGGLLLVFNSTQTTSGTNSLWGDMLMLLNSIDVFRLFGLV